MNNQDIAARLVRDAFPGVGFVAMPSASKFIGISEKTGRNWLALGRYPLQTVKVGDKRMVPVPALVNWYASQLDDAGVSQPVPVAEVGQVKRRPGRPRKNPIGINAGV